MENMTIDEFEELWRVEAGEYFSQLGFKKRTVKAEIWWFIIYLSNETTIVSLGYDRRDMALGVSLRPTPALSGLPDAFNLRYLKIDLQAIVWTYSPGEVLSPPPSSGAAFTQDEVAGIIKKQARLLKLYAGELLHGDFSSITEIRSKMNERRAGS